MNSLHQDASRGLEVAKLKDLATDGWWEQALDACFAAASTVSISVCLLDEELRCLQVNAALSQMSGLPVEAHLDQPLSKVFPDVAKSLVPICQRVFDAGLAVACAEITETLAQPEEQRSWVVSCFPVLSIDRPLVCLFMLETTAQKQLEAALSTSEKRFKALVQNSHEIINLKTLQQQFERERLINKIAIRMLQTLDLQDILDTAVTEVRQFLQADRVVISRREASGHYSFLSESVSEGWTSSLGFKMHSSWYEECFSPGHRDAGMVIDDLNGLALPAAAKEWADSLQMQSRLAMPIALGEQLWGMLAVHQCSDVRRWEPFEVELLEKLATQLAIAIQQSELHQQIQRLNDELEDQVAARTAELQVAFEFEATLKRITDRVRDSLDEDQILQAAVRELVLVLKISGCNASLYDLEQGTSTTCYEYTTSISPYQGRVSKLSAVPELYNQLLKGEYFQFCSLVPNPDRGLVAMLACPILDDQGVIGDLWLIHHKEYAFNEQDIRLVQQVANQCAIAIRQARLYEKSQSQVKELERLNQLKDDFLSTVSHELRTPLSNIKMAIHMLRTAPTPEKQERYMAILEAECNRETELINDLLDLQKLENDSYAVVLEPIDLQHWLPEVIAPFASRAYSRQQTLDIKLPKHLPRLLSDRRSLERILAELLNNACKYTPPNGTIAIKVVYRHQRDRSATPITTFVVSNQADVAPAEIPRIFEKFYRIPKSDPWQQGGTGLGLALVKKLVETLQGSITANSCDGWTTLQVNLPMPVQRE